MRQSQQVLEWQAQARQEGRHEGDVERFRRNVLRALEVRFRATVPADLADAAAALADPEELTRWFDSALAADSLDAFRVAVNWSAPPPTPPNGAAAP